MKKQREQQQPELDVADGARDVCMTLAVDPFNKMLPLLG
jgi:hypothetical protein